ncbi:hypothetical protein [Candidatus Enterococcus lemimoniae]|uniref:Uncharacterized protein n=1 Tax=Candidatus Enterococcus lemimoniae TaxID=1834167 RepID=A0ABZ2T4D7_9ENTE
MDIHFKDIKTENFPLIPNETSIMIKDKAAVFYDGTAITSADKMNGYIITGYKDIPEKYGSLRAYTIKGSNKLLYEGDVAIQTSPYPYLKNGTSVVLKQNAALDSDGKAISSEDKNKGYVIENVRDIRKKWDSIRIYKVQGLNRWFYEGDLEVQTSPYKIISTDTSVQIKESAYFYYGSKDISKEDRERELMIEDMRYIKKEWNSIRIYKVQESDQWFYESDLLSTPQ